MIDMRDHTDMVNHYLKVLCCYGFVGLLPFIGIIAGAIVCLVKAYKNSILGRDKWLVWCLAGVFFGTLPALVSVSLFGSSHTIFHVILGCAGAMPFIIERENFALLLNDRTTPRHIDIRQDAWAAMELK